MSRVQAIYFRDAIVGAGLLVGALALTACSHQGHGQQGPSRSTVTAAPAAMTTTIVAAPVTSTTRFSAFRGSVPANFTSIQCSLDDVNGSPAASAQTVAAGSSVTFRGWAGNGHAEPAKGFDLVLKSAQNAYAVALTTGVARADVAKALHSPAMGTSGYDFSAKLSSVVAGTYTVYIVNPLDSSENCDSQRTLSVH